MNYHEMIAKGFQGEPYSLFFHQWMWMGFGAAIVLLIFIFFTKYLRGDTTTPRMKDPAVLAWLGAVAYMLHNMEEYGVDLYGNTFAFPSFMYQLMGVRISEFAYLACNLCLVWVVGPLVAILVQRGYRRMASGMALFELINGLSHIVQAINLGCYNAGLLTSIVIFLPLGCWTLYVCYGREKMPRLDILWLFLGALAYHVVLLAGIMGATKLGIGAGWQGIIMISDAVLIFCIWWLVGRKGKVEIK